jgi:hypothetical protein
MSIRDDFFGVKPIDGNWLAHADLDRAQRTAIAVALFRGEVTMIRFTARQIAAITGIAEREIRNAADHSAQNDR